MKTSEYNGFKNYDTWNIALWICNDEDLYRIALGFKDKGYKSFAYTINALFGPRTNDGVKWINPKLDIDELNDFICEL